MWNEFLECFSDPNLYDVDEDNPVEQSTIIYDK